MAQSRVVTGTAPTSSLPPDRKHVLATYAVGSVRKDVVAQAARVPVSRRAKLVTAAVNFGLTAYATLTVAALKMLHCVWVPGTPSEERRLFVQASVVCNYSGWQVPYILLVAILVAIPAVLPFAAAWSCRPGGSVWDTDVRLGVRRAVVDSYHQRAYWWEAALMAQRLSLGLTVTFGASKPGVQAIVMTLLCFTFGYMHTIVAPMRPSTAQTLQSVLLFCLGVVALSATPFANALEGAVASPGSTNYDTPSGLLATRLQMALGVVTPLLALLWAYRREVFQAAHKHGSMVARVSTQTLGFFKREAPASAGPNPRGDDGLDGRSAPGYPGHGPGTPIRATPLAAPTPEK